MADGPDDPFSALAQGAVAAHEFFMSLVKAKFTEYQALYIVAQVIIAAGNYGNQGNPEQPGGAPED